MRSGPYPAYTIYHYVCLGRPLGVSELADHVLSAVGQCRHAIIMAVDMYYLRVAHFFGAQHH